jgi:hypothetical protein
MWEAVLAEQVRKASVVDVQPAPAWLTSTPTWSRPVTTECVLQEARRQSLEPWRLLAVLKAENGRVGMFRQSANGSYDIGPMQVNTIHLDELARIYNTPRGQLAQLLAYDGCFNVSVGAWMLRTRTNEAGGDFWYGIGRYHSKNGEKATPYILRVHSIMQELVREPAKR